MSATKPVSIFARRAFCVDDPKIDDVRVSVCVSVCMSVTLIFLRAKASDKLQTVFEIFAVTKAPEKFSF